MPQSYFVAAKFPCLVVQMAPPHPRAEIARALYYSIHGIKNITLKTVIGIPSALALLSISSRLTLVYPGSITRNSRSKFHFLCF